MAVTLEVLQREWQAKTFRPVYVFAGDEAFFMDQAMDGISEHSLEDHERDFNLTVLYVAIPMRPPLFRKLSAFP